MKRIPAAGLIHICKRCITSELQLNILAPQVFYKNGDSTPFIYLKQINPASLQVPQSVRTTSQSPITLDTLQSDSR